MRDFKHVNTSVMHCRRK